MKIWNAEIFRIFRKRPTVIAYVRKGKKGRWRGYIKVGQNVLVGPVRGLDKIDDATRMLETIGDGRLRITIDGRTDKDQD